MGGVGVWLGAAKGLLKYKKKKNWLSHVSSISVKISRETCEILWNHANRDCMVVQSGSLIIYRPVNQVSCLFLDKPIGVPPGTQRCDCFVRTVPFLLLMIMKLTGPYWLQLQRQLIMLVDTYTSLCLDRVTWSSQMQWKVQRCIGDIIYSCTSLRQSIVHPFFWHSQWYLDL